MHDKFVYVEIPIACLVTACAVKEALGRPRGRLDLQAMAAVSSEELAQRLTAKEPAGSPGPARALMVVPGLTAGKCL